MKEPNTLAEILKFHYEAKLPKIKRQLTRAKIDPKKRDALLRSLIRPYQPWPEWVLRVATEVLVVYLPSVKKDNIFKSLKAIHWIVFEAKINDDTEYPKFEFSPEIMSEILRVFGHVQRHITKTGEKIDELKQLYPNAAEIREEIEPDWQKNHKRAKDEFLAFLAKRKPDQVVPIMQTFVEANIATYDGEGRLRDTTATAIYKEILNSWEEIECFSGVHELCEFLGPILGHGDSEAKLDRVKKIVRRMEITFRPICQGTS
jgi:hypothetical protein